jgi:hypothetical protein
MEKACNSQAGGDGFLTLCLLLPGASVCTDVAALPGDGTSAAGMSTGGAFDEELLELAATSAELSRGAATQGTSSTKLISTSAGTESALPPAMLPP